MRDTIDFGIDLGTTNSAIAVATDGNVSVVKNNEMSDFTPSAVWMPRPEDVTVGRRARERAAADPDDAHMEFKQEMGDSDAVRRFARAEIARSPQQLSAEVLKSLRADVESRFGEPPQAAVITVPAAFQLHQTNATNEAAALAGFGSSCPLVQEPTAAAFAYGFQNDATDDYWMVFDLGGGTFDSAIVSTQDGELRVLDHAGDPHLGGKDIDWAIVDQLLAPVIAEQFAVTGFTRGDRAWRENFAKLKKATEEAKIALSRQDSVLFDVDLQLGGDRPESFEYTLRRADLDRIAAPYYLRAINLCRDALRKANLHPDNIDRLLLVGGATLAPGLRERLADPTEGLGIELDHSQDPTTVVACGAAVFASTLPLERKRVAPKTGEFSVDLEYPRTTSLTTATVAGRLRSSEPVEWSGYQVELSNPEASPSFNSGRIAASRTGTFVVEVLLTELVANTFQLTLFGPHGGRERLDQDALTIKHWANEPAGAVLTNSIGIAQSDGTFSQILTKGAALPASASGVYETSAALRRDDANAVVRIPIMEGERPRADRNLRVGIIEIRSGDVHIDLAKGSDVEITVEVDASRMVTVVADVPLVGEQFDATLDLSSVVAPDPETLRNSLAEVEKRLARLRGEAERSRTPGAGEILERLDAEQSVGTAHDQVSAASQDSGSAAAAEQRIRDLHAELDDVEAAIAFPALLDRANGSLAECRTLVDQVGDAGDRGELARLERRLVDARTQKDSAAIKVILDRASDLQLLLLRRDGSLDIQIFYALREMEAALESPGRARSLIEEGERAIAAQRWEALPGVNQRLRRLLPPDMPDPSTGGVQSSDRNSS